MDIKTIIIIVGISIIAIFKLIEWKRGRCWDKELKKLLNELPKCKYPGCEERASVKYLGFNDYCTEHMEIIAEEKGDPQI